MENVPVCLDSIFQSLLLKVKEKENHFQNEIHRLSSSLLWVIQSSSIHLFFICNVQHHGHRKSLYQILPDQACVLFMTPDPPRMSKVSIFLRTRHILGTDLSLARGFLRLKIHSLVMNEQMKYYKALLWMGNLHRFSHLNLKVTGEPGAQKS